MLPRLWASGCSYAAVHPPKSPFLSTRPMVSDSMWAERESLRVEG